MTTSAIKLHQTVQSLSPTDELALLCRVLHRVGYDDHTFGHITYWQPNESLLVTPFEVSWAEISAGDIMRIDLDGQVLAGEWTVTPAISLHLELHRARPGTGVIVHNHPHYGSIYSALGRVPPVYDQTGGLIDEIVVFDDYVGAVSARDSARAHADAMGSANMALLRHHGVLVMAGSIRDAYVRCSILERRCRLAWQVEAVSQDAVPLPEDAHRALLRSLERLGGVPHVWESAVRRELSADMSVLE